eukprot:CAMPEP_0113481652 /NCGR_PEP_ID=MMETSP0014_2-20120614/22518_1 /TAXON_ID=2857 /ORGANISM="Nitzschia sp." /LENGTH=538 /DNA_ID=CAMNT_0000375153 /DNA_START=114 /DNA_END=1730 /DNA_ORIENTATION=- /assembly_acc=CAM_ASM_000159
MKFFVGSTALALASSFVAVTAQEALLPVPTVLWTTTLSPDPTTLSSVDIEAGNGVFMAPDNKTAVVGTVGAVVAAFDAFSGTQLWTYEPTPIANTITRSHSNIIFSPDNSYWVYSVVDNENSFEPTTRVIAADFAGNEIWVSESLEGIPAGSPQVSTDGSLVFLTHNAMDQGLGYFTILDATMGGAVWYSEPSMTDFAFGPPGIYHTPVEGNYDPIGGESGMGAVSEGEFNTNDIVMWGNQPKPTDTSIANGFMYAFQLPREFDGNVTSVSYFQMGTFERDFMTNTPPVITNDGLSAYWSVTRSSARCWATKRFSRARTGAAGFTRNDDFAGTPIFSTPALSNPGDQPTVFFGTAANEFVRMNFDYTEQLVKGTSSIVYPAAKVDGGERVVYWVESSGTLHSDDFTLAEVWTYPVGFTVEGEMALSPKSDILVVADTRGSITALQVADILETEAPSDIPSDMPSMAPSGLPPPVAPIAPVAPVAPVAPTETPVAPVAPVAPVTDAPVVAPTAAPSAAFGRSSVAVAAAVAIVSACLMI